MLSITLLASLRGLTREHLVFSVTVETQCFSLLQHSPLTVRQDIPALPGRMRFLASRALSSNSFFSCKLELLVLIAPVYNVAADR